MQEPLHVRSENPPWGEAEKIIAAIRAVREAKRSWDPQNLVFEYSEYADRGQAIIMDRRNFDDGRHRVILHPDHREAVESYIKTLV